MKTTEVQEQINVLKRKVNSISAELNDDIYSICEQLDYTNSSRFSYNIDNLKKFKDYLNEFKITEDENNRK
jgi:hypothetical protein